MRCDQAKPSIEATAPLETAQWCPVSMLALQMYIQFAAQFIVILQTIIIPKGNKLQPPLISLIYKVEQSLLVAFIQNQRYEFLICKSLIIKPNFHIVLSRRLPRPNNFYELFKKKKRGNLYLLLVPRPRPSHCPS